MILDSKHKELIFYGCPAGIGNRYEELARLSQFAKKNNIIINYFWNNSEKLKYKNRFKAENLIIKEISILKKWPTKNFESSRYWREYISTTSITNEVKVALEYNGQKPKEKYIGIHIRGTDRVLKGNSIPQGFQNEEDVKFSIIQTEKYLKTKNNHLPIVIFSEDEKLKSRLLSELKDFNHISLPSIQNLEKEYQDIFYLSKSEEIIMCSRFSTYSLAAATFGNKKIINFYDKKESDLKLWDINIKNFPERKKKSLVNKYGDLTTFNKAKKFVSVGNGKIQSFKILESVVNESKHLVSYNKKNYIGFEENFKILNNSLSIQMCSLLIIKSKFQELINLLKYEKNRKIKTKKFIKELADTYKIFNLITLISKSKKKYLNKDDYFLFIDVSDMKEDYKNYINKDKIKGAVITFDDLAKEYEKFIKIKKYLNSAYISFEITNETKGIIKGYLTIAN